MSPLLRTATGRWRLVALLVTVLALANLLAQLAWALDAPPKTDYLPFATGARVVADHPGCAYCLDTQASTQASILGYVPPAGFPKPFVNPPLVALLLRPLAGLPLRTGLAVLLVVLLGALAWAARLLLGLLPPEWAGWRRALLVLAGLLSLPAATSLALAQWAPLLVLAGLGALVALRRGRAVAAGLLLSVLLVKPQTVWLVLPLLAVAGSWRVLLGFAGGAAGWAASGLVLVGPGQMLQLPRLVLERHVDEAQRSAGLPGLVSDVAGSGRSAFLAAVVVGVLVVAGAGLVRARLRGRPELAVGIGVAASLVCAPHVFPDDLMLLAVTAAVWAPLAPSLAIGALLALSAAYQLDGWLPATLAHLTPLATLAVGVGAAMATLRRPAGAAGVPVAVVGGAALVPLSRR